MQEIKETEEPKEAVKEPMKEIEVIEYEYQVFVQALNGQQGIIKVQAKDLEEAREKVKPHSLIGAFAVLETIQNEKEK